MFSAGWMWKKCILHNVKKNSFFFQNIQNTGVGNMWRNYNVFGVCVVVHMICRNKLIKIGSFDKLMVLSRKSNWLWHLNTAFSLS